MSWMAAASGGSAIMGGVSGISSNKKAKAEKKKADQARIMSLIKINEFSGVADKFANLGQEQFDKYQDMFGGFEETLNDYYMNLNPDELAAQGNQTAQQQYQQSMSQFNDQMAAQGMVGSGMQAQIGMEGAINMGQQKAQNLLNAPHQVAEMQQGWMNYGAGRQDNAWNQMSQGVDLKGSVTNMYTNAFQDQANSYERSSNTYSQNANQAFGSMAKGLGSAMYFGGKEGKDGSSPFGSIFGG